MNPTIAVPRVWAAGMVTAPAVPGCAIHWRVIDTPTGKAPDLDRVACSREHTAEPWSLEAAADHERGCEQESGGCRPETRWRRFRAWQARREAE